MFLIVLSDNLKKQLLITLTILANIVLLVLVVNSPSDFDKLEIEIEEPTTRHVVLGESSEIGIVDRVIDGDTIELSTGEKVRYIGIDTPEISGGIECYGEDARDYNEELVLGEEVRLEKDVSETDRYGRLLRYVYVELEDGEYLVNDALVRGGYAYASSYPPDVAMQDIFNESQAYAEENELGLWSSCSEDEYIEEEGGWLWKIISNLLSYLF